MNTMTNYNYERISTAIEFIRQNFRSQPGLQEIADEVHVSPHHFQRVFTEWAGVTPKKFLQYISLNHAKRLLREEKSSLFDVALQTGFSGSSRLHDLFIGIEKMTPGVYKNGGQSLTIRYGFYETPFGQALIANTETGICHIAFVDDQPAALAEFHSLFPEAEIIFSSTSEQKQALPLISGDFSLPKIKLHLKGSDFQLKVWEALLKIPLGKLATYGQIAREINQPNASRAVGSAIGHNPVAFLIPCHRVIRSNGIIGDYHWGSRRKTAIIGWESAKVYQ